MKVLELELKEFDGVYHTMHTTHLKLDLRNTKNRICLITGPNGHGKTLLLSQLTPFATLGGVDEREALPLIREKQTGYKKIVIAHKDCEYVIEHIYTPNKDGHTIKSYIKKDGVELNPNGNVTSFKEVVANELDTQLEYMKLVRLGNNVVNLIDLKNSERKSFMSKIMEDANVYLKHYKKINGEVLSLKTMISVASNKLSNLPIQDVTSAKELLENKRKELDESYQKRAEEKARLEKDREEMASLPADLEDLWEESKASYKKIQKYEGEGSLEDLQKELETAKTNLLLYRERKEHLKTLLNEKLLSVDKKRDLKEELEGTIHSLWDSENRKGLEDSIEILKETLKEEELRFAEYSEVPYTKEDIEKALSFLKEKQVGLNTMYEFGKGVMKTTVELMMEKRDVDGYCKKHIQKILSGETSSGAKELLYKILGKYERLSMPAGCPGNCQILSLCDDLNQILGEKEEEDHRGKEFYQYVEMVHKALLKLFEDFRKEKDTFEKLPQYLKDGVIAETILKRIANCEPIYVEKDYFNELSFITDYELFLSHKDLLKEREEELETLTKNSPLAFYEKRLSEVNAELSKEEPELANYRDGFNRTKELEEEAEELVETLSKKAELIQNRDQIMESYETIRLQRERKKELLTEIEDLSLSSLKKERITESLKNEIGELTGSIQSIHTLKKELKVYQKYYDTWMIMKESLSTSTGVPLIFMDMYLNKAMETVNTLLEEIYHGRMYVEKFDISPSSFEIPFIKDGVRMPDIRYASQGEKAFFSIVLSFAISFHSMSDYNIMLLDELDSVLDTKNRSNYISVLEKLLEMISAEQVFVISHNNMFSMYPVDVVSVINEDPEDTKLANRIPLEI